MRTIALFLLALVACANGAGPGLANETASSRPILRVKLDEARILRLDTPAMSLVIGNPSIADATVHDGRTIIITGKSFGTTNLIAIDRLGNIIAERQLQVQQPESSILTVQRADEVETLSCTPTCRRTPVIGDAARVFEPTIAQTQNRNAIAQQSGAAR
jgi:hypothetical protein